MEGERDRETDMCIYSECVRATTADRKISSLSTYSPSSVGRDNNNR